MSAPHDPAPPPPSSTSELPIPAGDAQRAMLAALANLTAAVVEVERIAMALARAVDATAPRGTP